MENKAILFDFDGVIVDTFELSLTISREVGYTFTPEEYRKLFEGNIYTALEDLHKREMTEKDDEVWFSRYSPRMLALEPVEGMLSVLKGLGEKYVLAVVSSTINSPIEEYLAKHNLTLYFNRVLGADVHRSKVEKIRMVFDEFSLGARDCLFITDTLGDMKEAHVVNVESIGVTWGFHTRETLLDGSPVAVVDSPSELVSAVDLFFGK